MKLYKYILLNTLIVIICSNIGFAETKEYVYKEAGFKASFPIKPKYEKDDDNNLTYKIMATKDKISYSVIATFADVNLEEVSP